MQTESSGLVILNSSAPDPATNTGVRLLSGDGQSRYAQFEATARLRLDDNRQLFFSYVRSHARGDLNDFADYLGSFPMPIVHVNQIANLPGDLPNRFLRREAPGRIPDRSAAGVSNRISLQLPGRFAALCGSAELLPVSQLFVAGRALFQGFQGESEIHAAIIGELV
jgi:hypothetical protein